MNAIDTIIDRVQQVVGTVASAIYGRHIRASLTNNQWLVTEASHIRVSTPIAKHGLRVTATIVVLDPDTNQQATKRYTFTYGKTIKGVIK